MAIGLLAILLILLTTLGLGLIGGALMAALLEGNSATTSSRQMSRERKLLSRAQLRGFLLPALFFVVVGMILLIYGYSINNPVWLAIGYGSLFFASLFLGGLLYQSNV